MTCKIKLVCSKQKVCTENFQDITFLLRTYYSVANYYYSREESFRKGFSSQFLPR